MAGKYQLDPAYDEYTNGAPATEITVDCCGIDFRDEVGNMVLSTSLLGVDLYDMAYRLVGDEPGDVPDSPAYKEWVERLTLQPHYFDQEVLEGIAHAALVALARMKER